jgi:hypothetical protein
MLPIEYERLFQISLPLQERDDIIRNTTELFSLICACGLVLYFKIRIDFLKNYS